MSNHIVAKFFYISFSPIPMESFKTYIPKLIEALRSKFPRYFQAPINQIKFDVVGEVVTTSQYGNAEELHMVDAIGQWGIKIGNHGLSMSSDRYVSYPDAIKYLKDVYATAVDILNITHFSQVSLRNINLFKESPTSNQFEDIKDKEYWGRQNFNSLESRYTCGGAATRHEYFDLGFIKQIQVVSAVVFHTQSFIPQDEWNIFSLRGEIPVNKETKPQLLIDIAATRYESSVSSLQQNVTECNWEVVEGRFAEIHEVLNEVYTDITQE